MGKRETKETYNDTKAQQGVMNTAYGNAITQNNSQASDASQRSDESRGATMGAYNGFLDNGGLGGFTPKSVSASHVAANHSSMPGFTEFSQTGGYDDPTKNSVNEDIGTLKQLQNNGGLDAEAMARMRGGGVFDEFAKTGGLSDKDQGNIRAKALSPISSMATGMNDELQRRRAVQGGYAPGFDASSRALRRDTSRNIADTSLNAELGIKDAINSGRMWGSSQMSGAEGNLQNLRTNNMYRGATGAADATMNMQNAINANKMGGLQGMMGNDNMDLSAGMFNSGADNQASMFNADQDMRAELARQQGKEFGASGMNNIFQTDTGVSEAARDRGLNILNSQSGAYNSANGTRSGLATQPGIGGNIMGAVTGGLGMASNWLAPGAAAARGGIQPPPAWFGGGQ